jgi:AraC-like DNA-binding protein
MKNGIESFRVFLFEIRQHATLRGFPRILSIHLGKSRVNVAILPLRASKLTRTTCERSSVKYRSVPLTRDSGCEPRKNLSVLLDSTCVQDQRIRHSLEIFQRDPRASLESAALRVNLSASRFRHLFKEELGVSPVTYLRLVRLKQARSLLEGSFLRIKEVAAQVGMNDLSHFVRDYKALYGERPSQTRAISYRVSRPIQASRFGQ